MPALPKRATTFEGQAGTATTARELGVAAVCAGIGIAQVQMLRMRSQLLAAFSGDSATEAGHRAVPAEHLRQALRRGESQLSVAPGTDRWRDRGAVVS